MNYRFKLDFKVRDYECDIQGIVNNSVYQNYLEHSRHEFLISTGLKFSELSRQHINLVAIRAELDYITPLKSGDEFWVGLNLRRASKIRLEFQQSIHYKHNDKMALQAITMVTTINERGRPFLPKVLEPLFNSAD